MGAGVNEPQASSPRAKALRLAVLFSGGGRTLENLVERSRAGSLPAEVVLAISSDPKAGGVERAKSLSIPLAVLERKTFKSTDDASRAIYDAVEAAKADLVCLAGYLHLVRVPEQWRGRVLNIHPALLPAFCGKGFYGDRVHRAVLEQGVKVTGCTVHFCDETYDTGPIIVQRTVPVLDTDDEHTLAARVFEAEKEAYPEAIRLIAEGRVVIEGRRVRLRPGS
jgi:phosphoribosylglycinamide formyltransferase-1